MKEYIQQAIINLREQKPIVLNLTNFVTMDFVANCLLALGAAPIMTNYNEELEELVCISSVIYLNIGTLDADFIERCRQTIILAKKYHKPIVLDPVGAGATKIRTHSAKEFASSATIVRGNASEILALCGGSHSTKGVESVHKPEDVKYHAQQFALESNSAITISGAVDFITNGSQYSEVPHGSDLMPLVTGMGCALTAVIAAFKAVIEDPFQASVIATHYYGICGEKAAQECHQPGTFKHKFIDYLRDFKSL